jgi:hydroxymethylbilane synthase
VATIRIATRGSAQAVTQSRSVADRLELAGHRCELVLIETFGDRTQAGNVPLHTIGGQGVFVKEVQRAVLDGRAEIAVHSAKDLPSATAEGLVIGAFVARRSVADALVGRGFDELDEGAPVLTGSVRRRAQIQRMRPDLTFGELRGNIQTRLDKVPDGGAIVMAVAALEVLGLTDRIAEVLDPSLFVPAVGQGCVAVEVRSDDADTLAALAAIDHAPTRREVTIERAFLAELGSGCSLPVGAWVDEVTLHAFLAGELATVCESVGLSGDMDTDLATAAAVAALARRRVGE